MNSRSQAIVFECEIKNMLKLFPLAYRVFRSYINHCQVGCAPDGNALGAGGLACKVLELHIRSPRVLPL